MRRILPLLLAALLLLAPATALAQSQIKVPDIPYQNTDPNKYFIEVDRTNQVITIFEKDESGAYTKQVRQFICTTGGKGNSTPSGTFKMGEMRERFGYFVNFNTYAQYWSQVNRGIYFHTIMFSRRDEKYLERSAFNNLGRAVSHGCIRMLVEDARFIYYHCPPGTTVTIRNKARNSALTKSLKPKMSYSEYTWSKDPYPQPAPVYGKITTTCDYRTGFGGKDRRLGSIKAGAEVEVLQLASNWAKVRIIGQSRRNEGYIYTKYLQLSSGQSYMSITKVSTNHANLYAEPDTNSSVLAVYGFGTDVKILSSTKYFHKVSVGGKNGYIRKVCLTTENKWLEEGESYTPTLVEIDMPQTPAPEVTQEPASATDAA